RDDDTSSEWRYLERAHIVSQPLGDLHVRTHLAMLGTALRHREWHEVLGQLFRLAVAAPGSVTARDPVGNTGGATGSPVAPMPMPDDLQQVLDDATGAGMKRDELFPTETDGLPEAATLTTMDVRDGGRIDLRIAPVVKQLGRYRLRMLAYDGSIPGPTIR